MNEGSGKGRGVRKEDLKLPVKETRQDPATFSPATNPGEIPNALPQ